MTESVAVRSSPTPGSVTMRLSSPSICESPSGVSASPRKSSVVTRASPESEKSSSISAIAFATAFPCGSVSDVSGGGARRSAPRPSNTVMMRTTRIVNQGRAVTTLLNVSSNLLIAYLSI